MDLNSEINIIKEKINTFFDLLFLIDNLVLNYQLVNGTFLKVNVSGNLSPYLIGKHGKVLESLQLLLDNICLNLHNSKIKIILDVNNYKEQKISLLRDFVNNVAKKVILFKRSITLRPMNSYERFIVHEYISSNYPELKTYSIGEKPKRRVVINLKS